jgi:hypothetical protein
VTLKIKTLVNVFFLFFWQAKSTGGGSKLCDLRCQAPLENAFYFFFLAYSEDVMLFSVVHTAS